MDPTFESKGVYTKIQQLLRDAAKDYSSKNPQKREKSLNQQLMKLRAQLNILENESKAKKLAQQCSENYPGPKYEDIISEKIAQLQNEITRLQNALPKPSPQVLLPPS